MITKGILGTKGSTEQVFDDAGNRVPATRVHTAPCYVVDIKSMDVDGYWAVLLGFAPAKNIKKSKQGLFKKAGIKTPLRFLKEIRFSEGELLEDGKKKGLKIGDLELWIGQELKPSALFAKEEVVTATGVSKGKGFQGVVKRHGFKGGPRTHGQSDRERAPGSIGAGTTPGRVYKGKKMAGRMGSDTTTIKNLAVIDVTDDSIVLKGLLPGAQGNLIIVRSSAAVPEQIEEAPVEDVEEKSVEQAQTEETKVDQEKTDGVNEEKGQKDTSSEKPEDTDEKASDKKEEAVSDKDADKEEKKSEDKEVTKDAKK